MKFAALLLTFLFTLQLWSAEIAIHLVGLKHLSDDDYILQIDFITTVNDPGTKPLPAKEVESRLPKGDPLIAEYRKDHPNWFIDSQKYLVKKSFKSTFSYRDDKFQRDFTGEVTSSGGKGEFTSVRFKFSRMFPPFPANDDDKTIVYRHHAMETTVTMKDGETQIFGGTYSDRTSKPDPSAQRLIFEKMKDK